jgi:putative ABC transport system permease protein
MVKKLISKQSFYIFTIFFIATIFISLSISTIESVIKDDNTQNGYVGRNAKFINIKSFGKIDNKKLLNIIRNMNDFTVFKNNLSSGPFTGKAILTDEINDNGQIVKDGRFFTSDDFKSNEGVAVVGEDAYKKTYKKNGITYFPYENSEYRVIGILGFKNRQSVYDSQFYINLNCLIMNSPLDFIGNNIILDSKNNADLKFNEFINKLKNDSNAIEYNFGEDKRIKNPLLNYIKDSYIFIGLVIAIVVCLVLNTFSVTLHWIDSRKKEIGIRKALGGTNFKIASLILVEYQTVSLLAFVAGLIVYIVVIKTNILKLFNGDIYLNTAIITFLLLSLIGLITSIVPIRKSMRIQPSEVMKGAR